MIELQDPHVALTAVATRMPREVLVEVGAQARAALSQSSHRLPPVQITPRPEVFAEALAAPVLPALAQAIEVTDRLDLSAPPASLDQHEQMFA